MLRLLTSGSGATSGFSDNKGDGLSRYTADLGGSHFDDPAFKRPKVGGSSGAQGRSSGAEAEGTLGDTAPGRDSPNSPESERGSDSDSDNPKHRKKKKKKKKNKLHDQAPEATPPPRPGGAQMKTSQSEPSVGAKLSAVDDGHGGSGIGKLQPSPTGPQALS